ncbi:MAG: hypothetical protein JWR21_2753 [Herminiimonas sp.]|nr:hypothetical protein [Herminiimonas sp.]
MSTINTAIEASVGNTGSDSLARISAFFASLLTGLPADVDTEAADDAGVIYGAFGL